MIEKVRGGVRRMVFMVYWGVRGVRVWSILIVYRAACMASTLVVSGGMLGGMRV